MNNDIGMSLFMWHAPRYSEGRGYLACESRPSVYLRACHMILHRLFFSAPLVGLAHAAEINRARDREGTVNPGAPPHGRGSEKPLSHLGVRRNSAKAVSLLMRPSSYTATTLMVSSGCGSRMA